MVQSEEKGARERNAAIAQSTEARFYGSLFLPLSKKKKKIKKLCSMNILSNILYMCVCIYTVCVCV